MSPPYLGLLRKQVLKDSFNQFGGLNLLTNFQKKKGGEGGEAWQDINHDINLGLTTKNFNICGVHWKTWFLMGGMGAGRVG